MTPEAPDGNGHRTVHASWRGFKRETTLSCALDGPTRRGESCEVGSDRPSNLSVTLRIYEAEKRRHVPDGWREN